MASNEQDKDTVDAVDAASIEATDDGRTVLVELTGYELAAVLNCYSRGLATMSGNLIASLELTIQMGEAFKQLGPKPAVALMHRLADLASATFPDGVRTEVPADHLATDAPLDPLEPFVPQENGGLVS